MALGGVVSVHSTVVDDGYLTIQPSGTAEWGIQNIYIPAGVECEIYRTDGTTDMLLFTVTDTLQFAQPINPTNAIYFKVKNISGTSTTLGYDGKISKV